MSYLGFKISVDQVRLDRLRRYGCSVLMCAIDVVFLTSSYDHHETHDHCTTLISTVTSTRKSTITFIIAAVVCCSSMIVESYYATYIVEVEKLVVEEFFCATFKNI